MRPPKSSKPGAERREHERLLFSLRVTYRDRASYLGDWTENLSQGGLFVRTEERFEVGDAVTLNLSFPGVLEPVTIVGTVAWVRSPAPGQARGVGIRVDDERSRRVLAEFALLSVDDAQPDARRHFRVVVAEDNPHVARTYERVLEHIAHSGKDTLEVLAARNGQQALELLAQAPADLLIADLYMPVMDGVTMLREIAARQLGDGMAVLVVTSGSAEENQAVAGLKVDAVIEKPFEFDRLFDTLVTLLRKRT